MWVCVRVKNYLGRQKPTLKAPWIPALRELSTSIRLLSASSDNQVFKSLVETDPKPLVMHPDTCEKLQCVFLTSVSV